MSGKGQIIVLQVYLEPTEATKTMKFPADIPIHSIITDIQKIQGLGVGGRDHGLFRAPIKGSLTQVAVNGCWMERARTLKYYNIKNNALIEYKKKHRPMEVKLIDDSVKSFIVDDSQSVRKISDKLGEHLDLGKDAEQFCLCWPGSTIKKPLWLEENLTLHEQPDPNAPKAKPIDEKNLNKNASKKIETKKIKAVDEVELPKGPLLLWKRYYAHDSDISKLSNSFLLNIYFIGTMRQILCGMFPLGRVDAKNFAALQLQATQGDYVDPQKNKDGSLILIPSVEILPPLYQNDKKLPIDIYAEWKRLKGANKDVAKNRYIQLARSMKTYGMTFYDFTETKMDEVASKKSKKQKFIVTPICLGVASTKLAYYNPETNQFTKFIPYTSLRRYEILTNTLTLMLAQQEGEDGPEVIQLESPYADEVYALVEGYIAIILRERQDTQKVISDESGSVAEMEEDEAKWFQADVGTQGRGFQNPNAMYNYGMPGGMMRQADPDESRMVNHVTNLDDAIKGMKGISDHITSGKGAWGQKKSETEWKKDLTSANVFIAPALADFLEECRLNEKGNRRMLDVLSKSVYANALNMTQAGQQLAALNDDCAALLDGAKAVADSLADIMSLCSDEKNPPSEALLDACLKQHNIMMHLIKDPELLHHIDSGSEYLLMNCLYDIDNQASKLISTALQNPDLLLKAKQANQIKGLALTALAALIPYASSPTILSQISVAEDMLLQALMPLGMDLTNIKEAIALLGIGKNICENSQIDGNIDITSPAADLLSSLALIRAEMATGNTAQLYSQVGKVQAAHSALKENMIRLIPNTEDKLSIRLTKADFVISQEIDNFNQSANILMTENLGSSVEAQETMKKNVLERIGKLEEQSQLLIVDVGVLTTLNNLRHHSKQVAADLIRLKTATAVASELVPEKNARELTNASKDISTSLNYLFADLKAARDSPNNIMVQTKLMQSVQKEMPDWEHLIKTSTGVIPILHYDGDDALKKAQTEAVHTRMTEGTSDAKNSTHLLKRAVKRMGELEGNMLISQALMELEMIKATVENAEVMASQGQLPFDHRLDALASAIKVQKASEKFLQLSKQLVVASTEEDAMETMPELIMANVNALERLIATQHNLAGITSDKRLQTNILRVAHQTVEDSINLIAVSRVINDIDCTQDQIDLAKEAQAKILDHLVNLQSGYGEADHEEIKSLKDDVERKKFKIAMGPLQSATKTQPIIEEQTLLLERAFTLSLNQLVDAVLYNPKNTRFPLSVFVGVSVDLLEQFTFHPKLTGKVKMEIGEFHENLVKVIDAIQLLGKARNQENIDALLTAAQNPPKTLRAIVESLLGQTKSEVNQSVLDLMSVLDMIESGKVTAFPTIKDEVLAEMSLSLGSLNKSLAPIVVPNDLATSNPSLLTTVAMEASKIAAQLATTANASKRPAGQKQPCSLAASRVLQTCDIANNNNTNKILLVNVGKTSPAMLNKLIVSSRAAMEKESDSKKREVQLKALEDVITVAKPFIKECNHPNNNLKIVGTSVALKDKVLALQEALYTVPKDASELNAFSFTPVESQKLCNVSKAVAISAANLIQNSLLTPTDCESNVVYDEKQKKAQAEFESNMRILSKLITDKEETKELVLKTIDLVRLSSFQLISAETAVTFGQSLALPDDFDKEKSTHANDAYNSTLQCIVNVKNILDAYKTNDPQKLASTIGNIKTTMNTFGNQIVTTAAMMNDCEKQKEILTPSATFAVGLLPLLKSIETHDVSDTDSFPAIVQSALPVINTLKVLNEKLANQRSNQDKIDQIMQSVNEAIALPADNPSSNYEQNRAQLIQGVHKVGLDLAQLVNSQSSADLILKYLDILASSTKEFLAQAKNTVASCPDKSVAHTLNDLTDNVGKSVVKAIGFSKDEVIGINLHNQQLGNFHSSIAEIDKVVNLLTSVEKVLLEGTSAEILDSIASLTKLKLLVQNDEIARVPDYAEKSSHSLASRLPQVNNACQKLSGVNNLLGAVDDLKIGTQANPLSANTKLFDEAIYDTVFSLKNKKDQEDIIDRAIDVTILESSALNPKLGSAGRLETTNGANQKLVALQQKIQDVVAAEDDETKRLEKRFNDTIERMRAQFQPHVVANVQKRENSSPINLVQDCQNILGIVSKSMMTNSFADSVTITEGLPALLLELLSTEFGFPDLDASLRDDFLNSTKELADFLAEFLRAQAKARDHSGHLNESLCAPNLQKVVEGVAKIQDLTRRLPSNLVADIVDDGAAKDIEQSTEDELMKCAQMIQDAVKLLSSVQSGAKAKSSVGISTQDVSEAILEAARSIGMGVGDLVTAAALVQSERKVAAQTSSNKYNADPAWANGLVSAAQLVTENVRQLVTAANNTAKGGEGSEEEKLVALSKAVAAVTVSLLTASRSKAEDPTANSQRQLTKAAAAVQMSTGQLVVAAQAAQELKDVGGNDDDFSKMDFKAASGLRAQMEQMGKIEKLEKELRDTHQELIKLRRARYQDKKSY